MQKLCICKEVFDQSVYDNTIKLIRDRVGMGNVDISTMSDQEKIDLINYERNMWSWLLKGTDILI